MVVTFKQLKDLLSDVDRNTLETTVIKHLLRITSDDINTDVLYNAESESSSSDIPDTRYVSIVNNVDNTCPDLYPK